MDYNLLIRQYKKLLELLQKDERQVSDEVMQIIHDDIEDIQIRLGNASQIQPKLYKNSIGYDIE